MNYILPILVMTISISCTKTKIKKVCDVKEPLTELTWLSNKIDTANAHSLKISISKAILKNKESGKIDKREEALIIRTGTIFTWYNCNGDVVCASGGFVNSTCEKYDVLEEEHLYSN